MTITRYEIRVPSTLKPGEPFEVRVIARDAQDAIVTSDSSTVVTMSADVPEIVFDGNENSVFGEMGDDEKALLEGILSILAKDTKETSFEISVTDSSNTGNVLATYLFSVILFVTGDMYETQIETLEHIRFSKWVGEKTISWVDPPLLPSTPMEEDPYIQYIMVPE
jgi:hypothetical protein